MSLGTISQRFVGEAAWRWSNSFLPTKSSIVIRHHTTSTLPTNNQEWNKSQPPGQPPIEATFAREEIAIPVKCNEHPWMRAYIAVFRHPFFAVTGTDGRFELKNLPSGTYVITAWHEKLGSVEQKLIIGAKETKTLDFIFKPRRSYGTASLQ